MPIRRFFPAISCLLFVEFLWLQPTANCVAVGPAQLDATFASTLTRGLDSPLFAEREAATRQLVDAAGAAVPALVSVAKEGSLEAAVRAVGILETIYCASDAKGDGAVVDAAEFALDDLTRSGRASVTDRAEAILESHYDIRERRAVAEIERLGGKTRYMTAAEAFGRFPLRGNIVPPPLEPATAASKDRGELISIIIGPKWKAGDEGLKHVARLKRLKMLYRIEGKQVTDEAVARLRAAIPGLEVHVRSAAKLGIEAAVGFANGEEKGCVIKTVEPGEAAANSGLRNHDVILRFAGRPVDDFYALVEMLRTYKPGDTLEAIILRDDVRMTIPVTLTGWD